VVAENRVLCRPGRHPFFPSKGREPRNARAHQRPFLHPQKLFFCAGLTTVLFFFRRDTGTAVGAIGRILSTRGRACTDRRSFFFRGVSFPSSAANIASSSDDPPFHLAATTTRVFCSMIVTARSCAKIRLVTEQAGLSALLPRFTDGESQPYIVVSPGGEQFTMYRLEVEFRQTFFAEKIAWPLFFSSRALTNQSPWSAARRSLGPYRPSFPSFPGPRVLFFSFFPTLVISPP